MAERFAYAGRCPACLFRISIDPNEPVEQREFREQIVALESSHFKGSILKGLEIDFSKYRI